MMHGIEVRAPFLDHRLVEFAPRIAGGMQGRPAEQTAVARSLDPDLPSPASSPAQARVRRTAGGVAGPARLRAYVRESFREAPGSAIFSSRAHSTVRSRPRLPHRTARMPIGYGFFCVSNSGLHPCDRFACRTTKQRPIRFTPSSSGINEDPVLLAPGEGVDAPTCARTDDREAFAHRRGPRLVAVDVAGEILGCPPLSVHGMEPRRPMASAGRGSRRLGRVGHERAVAGDPCGSARDRSRSLPLPKRRILRCLSACRGGSVTSWRRARRPFTFPSTGSRSSRRFLTMG